MSRKRDKPRRLFRSRQTEPPPIPPEAELLAQAWKIVDPTATYRLDLGNGEVFETTGREMLETANAVKALANAQRRGDHDGMKRAVSRLGVDPSSEG